MAKDIFGNKINGNLFGFGLENSENSKKRTLGIRDKQILYRREDGICQACGKKIEFDEMESGHKIAASKGGNATLQNSVCVCARCNKLQGTDSWTTFMKKMKKSKPTSVTNGKKTKPQKTKAENKSTKTNKKSNKPLSIIEEMQKSSRELMKMF